MNKFQSRELDNFLFYERIRRSGKFNMITEAYEAAKAAGLTIAEYKNVIRNYVNYKKFVEREYGSVDNFIITARN